MLWRVRAVLSDRPGALARLATECGAAGVNILALRVFGEQGGTETVTDELVLRTPQGWDEGELLALVSRAGGELGVASRCTEEALVDDATRHIEAARSVIEQPASFPDVVARLFDADVRPRGGEEDVLEMTVGEVLVQVRRVAPFTAVERTRGAAMADLVSDVLARQETPALVSPGARRIGGGAQPDYVTARSTVTAVAGGVTAGLASLTDHADEPGVMALDIQVDAAWRRRGIGARLLTEGARLARERGADEVVLTTAHDNRAVLPMVMAAGMRGRIRMAGEILVVRISVR